MNQWFFYSVPVLVQLSIHLVFLSPALGIRAFSCCCGAALFLLLWAVKPFPCFCGVALFLLLWVVKTIGLLCFMAIRVRLCAFCHYMYFAIGVCMLLY